MSCYWRVRDGDGACSACPHRVIGQECKPHQQTTKEPELVTGNTCKNCGKYCRFNAYNIRALSGCFVPKKT